MQIKGEFISDQCDLGQILKFSFGWGFIIVSGSFISYVTLVFNSLVTFCFGFQRGTGQEPDVNTSHQTGFTLMKPLTT